MNVAAVQHASGPQVMEYQVSRCTTDELQQLLRMVFENTDQILAFAALIQDELIRRGTQPINPDVAS